MIEFGENWLIYKDKIMKHLQDIIAESILDDNIGDNSIVSMFFKSIMNAKSFKEFKDVALSLKSYLDDDLGNNYKKALNKTKQNRSGHYLSIILPDIAIPGKPDGYACKILVSSGPSNSYWLRFYESTGRVSIRKTNISFYDLTFADEDDYGPNDCVYILDDKWNELRKMIINKK